MGVGENIKALRKKSSLTQEEFAKLIGVSKETVCRWEKGRSAIRQSTLQTITSVFNLQPDDLTSEAAGLAAQNEFPKKSRPEENCQPSEMCDAFKIAMSSGRTGLKRTGTVPSPPSLLARHPNCFFVQMDTSAMSKCYPIGSLLLVDPNKNAMEWLYGVGNCRQFENGDQALQRRHKFDNAFVTLLPHGRARHCARQAQD